MAVQQEVATAELDLAAVLDLVCRRAQELTGAAGAVVERQEGDDMLYQAASGVAAGHVGLRLAAASSLSGLCMREGKPLVCDDSETDARVDREACRRIGLRSMAVVPLLHGRPVGVLKVLSPRVRAFTREDVETLRLMAGLVAASIARAADHEALRQSEARYRTLVEESPEAIFVRVGEKIAYANPVAVRLFGARSLADLVGRSVFDLVAPESRGFVAGRIEGNLRGETAPTAEVRMVRLDGAALDVEVTGIPMVYEGKPGAQVIVRDVSERRRADEQARRGVVTKKLVRRMLRHFAEKGSPTREMRREVGRLLAHEADARTLDDFLLAFDAMGVGTLRLDRVEGDRHVFHGQGMLDLDPGSPMPTCLLALGFVEGIVGSLTGRAGLGAETTCQSQGHPHCTFVVLPKGGAAPLPAAPSANHFLRRPAEGA